MISGGIIIRQRQVLIRPSWLV